MDEMMQIIRINAYIQRGMGKLFLSGKEVLCVALDRTCTCVGEGEGETELDDSQLEDVFNQTFGIAPEVGDVTL